jgi:hypothetical protein
VQRPNASLHADIVAGRAADGNAQWRNWTMTSDRAAATVASGVTTTRRRGSLMRNLRILAVALTIMTVLVACGSNAGASSSPGGGGGGGSSSEPSAEASSGGGGGGGDGVTDPSKGTAHFELSGAATKSGDFAIIPLYGAVFDPETQGVALVYADESASASLNINTGGAGASVTYADAEIGVILVPVGTTMGECSVDFDEFEADHVKGTFTCHDMAVVAGGEDILGAGTLSGSFEARK